MQSAFLHRSSTEDVPERRSIMKKLVGFTAAALAAVGVALAPAATDPNDDAYLADLKAISGRRPESRPRHRLRPQDLQ